jgi:hypothetical protein
MVVHACTPSYLGGGDGEDLRGQPGHKVGETPSQ